MSLLEGQYPRYESAQGLLAVVLPAEVDQSQPVLLVRVQDAPASEGA